MDSGIDASFRLLAARYIRKQAKQLSVQLEGVRRADDVECVHQVRVASRRLQAALKMFRDCLEPGQRTRWRKEIRRIVESCQGESITFRTIPSVSDLITEARPVSTKLAPAKIYCLDQTMQDMIFMSLMVHLFIISPACFLYTMSYW